MSKYKDMNDGMKLSDSEKEKLISDISAVKNKNHRSACIITASAVCLLAILGVLAAKNLPQASKIKTAVTPQGQTGTDAGVYVPETVINMTDGAQDSNIAFIVYGGRVYTGSNFVYNADDVKAKNGVVWDEYADISQKLRYCHVPFTVSAEEYEALKGDYLGSSTCTPNLCTSEEDRQRTEKAFEDPSSESFFGMEGNYYTLTGIPAEKCICCETETDGCRTLMPFYCLNGITLFSGKDVFGDLLDLKNAKKIQWLTEEEWNESLDETVYYHDGEAPGTTALKELEISAELLNSFTDALYTSVPVVRSEKTYRDFEKDMYNTEVAYLYFTLKNGLIVKLRIFSNGYVWCDCSNELLFRLEGTSWSEVIRQASFSPQTLCPASPG